MTDVITSDHIASVSLADADKDPQGFAKELGQASSNMASRSSATMASRRN